MHTKAEEIPYSPEASDQDSVAHACFIPSKMFPSFLTTIQLDLLPHQNSFSVKALKLNFKVKAKFFYLFLLTGKHQGLCLGATYPITNSATSGAAAEPVWCVPEPTRTPLQEQKQCWAANIPLPTLLDHGNWTGYEDV